MRIIAIAVSLILCVSAVHHRGLIGDWQTSFFIIRCNFFPQSDFFQPKPYQSFFWIFVQLGISWTNFWKETRDSGKWAWHIVMHANAFSISSMRERLSKSTDRCLWQMIRSINSIWILLICFYSVSKTFLIKDMSSVLMLLLECLFFIPRFSIFKPKV